MESEALQRIQELEQALHTHTVQKQSYEAQLLEVESAKGELENTSESYRIIGTIMVKADAKKLLGELDERHGVLTTRVTALKAQEEKLKEQMERLQKEVLGDEHGKL